MKWHINTSGTGRCTCIEWLFTEKKRGYVQTTELASIGCFLFILKVGTFM